MLISTFTPNLIGTAHFVFSFQIVNDAVTF